MSIHLTITNQEVTYLLRALKERQKTAKSKSERLCLAGLRDLVEFQTGRRETDDTNHFLVEWKKQQKEGKK